MWKSIFYFTLVIVNIRMDIQRFAVKYIVWSYKKSQRTTKTRQRVCLPKHKYNERILQIEEK